MPSILSFLPGQVHFRWSPRDGCRILKKLGARSSHALSQRPQSKEAILERAKASRARASGAKESAKKALEQARLYEKKQSTEV